MILDIVEGDVFEMAKGTMNIPGTDRYYRKIKMVVDDFGNEGFTGWDSNGPVPFVHQTFESMIPLLNEYFYFILPEEEWKKEWSGRIAKSLSKVGGHKRENPGKEVLGITNINKEILAAQWEGRSKRLPTKRWGDEPVVKNRRLTKSERSEKRRVARIEK